MSAPSPSSQPPLLSSTTVANNGRIIIIGDVHGCIDELRALLRKCHYRQGVDRLISVGDLVGKGPDSVAVVRLIRSLGGECVMGNWEPFVLGNPQYVYNDYKRAHPHATNPPPEFTTDELDWIRALPYTIDIPDHDCMVVHAGLVPGVAIDQQNKQDMMNMRNLLPDGTATKDIKQGTSWAQQWRGPRTIVFGHDAQRGFQRAPMAIGLDTGAVYGKQLTALILPGREICEVVSARVYSQPNPTSPPNMIERMRKCYRRIDRDAVHLPLVRSMLRLVMVMILLRLLWHVVERLPD